MDLKSEYSEETSFDERVEKELMGQIGFVLIKPDSVELGIVEMLIEELRVELLKWLKLN
ncbi:MAG: hypothetical protein Q9M91_05430 [Candidatus Dojkabacteria bacterium]|nr:hypothetical protein [Candidatus Dojkabacteria bacterium]